MQKAPGCEPRGLFLPAGFVLSEPAPSRASPLPQLTVVNSNFDYTHIPCGSGLAREEARSGDDELR
ncbi:hypothetical protein EKG40_15720 [Pseudomonas moorei]|nr:hypothetical protein EKG40_15720 [Pseudomonas moorei]